MRSKRPFGGTFFAPPEGNFKPSDPRGVTAQTYPVVPVRKFPTRAAKRSLLAVRRSRTILGWSVYMRGIRNAAHFVPASRTRSGRKGERMGEETPTRKGRRKAKGLRPFASGFSSPLRPYPKTSDLALSSPSSEWMSVLKYGTVTIGTPSGICRRRRWMLERSTSSMTANSRPF